MDTDLHLTACLSLKNLDGLANCTNLTQLALSGYGFLQNVDVLAKLTNLTDLDMMK